MKERAERTVGWRGSGTSVRRRMRSVSVCSSEKWIGKTKARTWRSEVRGHVRGER
jgi:hypothetical protein